MLKMPQKAPNGLRKAHIRPKTYSGTCPGVIGAQMSLIEVVKEVLICS